MNAAVLEKNRKSVQAALIAALLAEAAGLVLFFTGHATAGLLLAGAAAAVYALVRLYGGRWFASRCIAAAAGQGLLRPCHPLPRQEGQAAGSAALQALLPPGFPLTRVTVLHPFRGQMRGRDALVCEVSAVCGTREARYLVGTLLQCTLAGPLPTGMLLCGRPFGGLVRLGDYAAQGWQLFEASASQARILAASEADADVLREAWAQTDTAQWKDAAVYVGQNTLCVLLLGRFFSGRWPLNRPVNQSLLDQPPLPEAEAVSCMADAVALTVKREE